MGWTELEIKILNRIYGMNRIRNQDPKQNLWDEQN